VTRQYTNEFKAQVLKEVQEVGNAALVARRYELSKNTVAEGNAVFDCLERTLSGKLERCFSLLL